MRNHEVFIDTPEFNDETTLVIRVNKQTYTIKNLQHTINVFHPQIQEITIMQNPKNQICSVLNFENNEIRISCEMLTQDSVVKGFVLGLEEGESIIVRTGKKFLFSKYLKLRVRVGMRSNESQKEFPQHL